MIGDMVFGVTVRQDPLLKVAGIGVTARQDPLLEVAGIIGSNCSLQPVSGSESVPWAERASRK